MSATEFPGEYETRPESNPAIVITQPRITLLYGPYEAHGVIRHKDQRLNGVSERLTELGYDFTTKPIPHINRLSVMMRGREIFRCDIRNLYFNMYFEGDVVAERMVSVIEEATKRIFNASNVPLYDSVEMGTRNVHKIRQKESANRTWNFEDSFEETRETTTVEEVDGEDRFGFSDQQMEDEGEDMPMEAQKIFTSRICEAVQSQETVVQ